MNFDLWNLFLKIQESIQTPTPKVGAHLGMCGFIPSHFFTLPGVWMWLPGCTFGPHLSKPGAKVATHLIKKNNMVDCMEKIPRLAYYNFLELQLDL